MPVPFDSSFVLLLRPQMADMRRLLFVLVVVVVVIVVVAIHICPQITLAFKPAGVPSSYFLHIDRAAVVGVNLVES